MPISASAETVVLIGDEARRVRPDDDAGHDVADQRRLAQPDGDDGADERHAERRDEVDEQARRFLP